MLPFSAAKSLTWNHPVTMDFCQTVFFKNTLAHHAIKKFKSLKTLSPYRTTSFSKLGTTSASYEVSILLGSKMEIWFPNFSMSEYLDKLSHYIRSDACLMIFLNSYPFYYQRIHFSPVWTLDWPSIWKDRQIFKLYFSISPVPLINRTQWRRRLLHPARFLITCYPGRLLWTEIKWPFENASRDHTSKLIPIFT